MHDRLSAQAEALEIPWPTQHLKIRTDLMPLESIADAVLQALQPPAA